MNRQLALFATDLGWFGLTGQNSTVERLWFGHASSDEVRARAAAAYGQNIPESDWWSELRERLEAYAAGEPDDFRDVQVAYTARTAFQSRVIRALREVGYGATVSYGELAQRARAPGAARAVGSVMSGNVVPLIIPCHRVIGAGGRLGGFSAPQGLAMKRRLLEMEQRLQPASDHDLGDAARRGGLVLAGALSGK